MSMDQYRSGLAGDELHLLGIGYKTVSRLRNNVLAVWVDCPGYQTPITHN